MIGKLLLAAAFFGSAAFAGTDVKVAPFSAINVHGGGEVTVHYGPVQRVTIIKADMKTAKIEVNGSSLDLSACTGMCWGHHDLVVEVVTPRLEDVEVHGGGTIKAEGNFPKLPHMTVQVHGGGDADIAAIPVDKVDAQVHGGGSLRVKPISSLNAQAHGGGSISYVGHPAHIDRQTHGGGSIDSEN